MQNVNSIASLPTELLCNIFLKNTEQDDPKHNRLITARYSSQVCRSWRSILLALPSVWGRLLDLDYLAKAKKRWKQEIISRSEGASLWITGSLISSAASTFFISLVKDNWERVQHLDIEVISRGPDERWTFLHWAAPNLERLNIKLFNQDAYSDWDRTPLAVQSLFSNVAPQLNEFCIQLPGWLRFNVNTPCFSNIRIFTFPPQHTVPMIFSFLRLMPHVTHLRIDADRDVEHPPVQETDFVRIDLPFLETLQIRERHASGIVALLECIKPSSHCGLLVTQRIPRMGHHLDPLTSYDSILKWILAYINGRPPNLHQVVHIEPA